LTTPSTSGILTVTVLLANHEDSIHSYDVDLPKPGYDLALEILHQYLEFITGKSPWFGLATPSITYSSNVIGLKFDAHGDSEITAAVAQAQCQIGFPGTTTAP